ncbi:hypothetical protein HOK68_00800 [Candidatus Woesearchaeota archaeon]|jgi:hypothetical protein|nr:hypothetical protein [Candidatus Woesearchaeota archaeon]MBT4387297.1 hypothetical protein [Candidatus Woesearchaeota archaeon]MBT4595436.1 hypothetical protein [Candidatus Woesearchaeota archaeon]MBT5741151.1 hypothetical protein [Candidatus Woesearchaeota archaeon]MBT6505299.1 hypothetical protein [Candidatus Woesearchaeota archaeon]
MKFVLYGRKASGKNIISDILKTILKNDHKILDFGSFSRDQVKTNGEFSDYLKNNFAKTDDDGQPNFFDDINFRMKAVELFYNIGGFSDDTINIGLPRSVDQLKEILKLRLNPQDTFYIFLNVHDQIQKKRLIERYNDEGMRICETNVQKTLDLDNMFLKYSKEFKNYVISNDLPYIELNTSVQIDQNDFENISFNNLKQKLIDKLSVFDFIDLK